MSQWRENYKSTRIGAGYFLGQHGRLKFTPEGYISFRGVSREDSSQLMQEWDRWIRDLQGSSHEHVRNAAAHAPSMCREHLDAYYRDRVVAESEITSLENSSKKLADSEQELILLTQKRRAKRNAQDDSEDRDSMVGSLSVPPSSTPVTLKRGRPSRKGTDFHPAHVHVAPGSSTAPMISHAAPTDDPSAFGSSRPRISDPWHDLVRATLSMYEGEDVELPSEQSAVTEQDPEKNTLYKLALGHLQNAQAEMQEPKFDKISCTSFKDAFVALSGVWNVFSNEAKRAFQDADLQEVEELCRMTKLENKDADVVEILNALADKPPLTPLTDVVNELYILLSTKPDHRRLLLLLLTIGEQGCAATALSKSQLAKVFDTGTTTRKCDCLFTVKGLEVGNIEAKRSSATKLEVACQLRKNIKINKSVLLQLEKYGVECPPLLSIHGNTAIVFRVRRWKRIFVASRACPTLVLPTTADEWPLFLSRHAHVLNNLLEYYHNFSVNCAKSYSVAQYEERAALEDYVVTLSPEDQATLLEWEHVVLHTPTKPRLGKKKLSKAPDNALFWTKIKYAADNHEDEEE
ncbi:hypothetical protein EC991_010627 [Linnemannia zychae]|nr:hypothetical protein EC991_010627 [Linnemannia zychae]